jgi:hypothetical protein
MSTNKIKKRRRWLWIATAFLVIAVGGGLKAFYFGIYLSEIKHPVKPYKIVISKIPSFPAWQTGTPGDSGNSYIWVRLYDGDGNKLHEIRTTLNDLILPFNMWTENAAIITTDIVWPLPDHEKEVQTGQGSR